MPAIPRPFPPSPCLLQSLIPTIENTKPRIPNKTKEQTKPAMHIPLVGGGV